LKKFLLKLFPTPESKFQYLEENIFYLNNGLKFSFIIYKYFIKGGKQLEFYYYY